MADYQTIVPAQDRHVHVYTFQDVVDRLLDLFTLQRSNPRELRLATEAVLTAYREIAQCRMWAYYERRASLTTDTPFTTGTLTYDHEGGAEDRLVTFTDAIPSWGRWGRLYLTNGFYDIERVIDSTHVTLRQDNNPGADLASTAFKYYRLVYNLPNEFRTMIQMFDVTDRRWRQISFISHRDVHGIQMLGYLGLDTPWEACIHGDQDRYGTSAIEFSAASTIRRTYNYLYISLPRPLAIEYYAAGKVTVSGTTVTLTGGAFPEDCLGSIIRFSSVADEEPTGVAGNSSGVSNRYMAARVIMERTSDTTVVIDSALSNDISTGTRYVVSDPLDIDYEVMLNALYAMSELELSKRVRIAENTAPLYMQAARLELTKAKEWDQNKQEAAKNNRLHSRNRGIPDFGVATY